MTIWTERDRLGWVGWGGLGGRYFCSLFEHYPLLGQNTFWNMSNVLYTNVKCGKKKRKSHISSCPLYHFVNKNFTRKKKKKCFLVVYTADHMISFCSLTAYFHSSYSNQPKPGFGLVGLKYLNNQQNEMRNGYVEKTHFIWTCWREIWAKDPMNRVPVETSGMIKWQMAAE